MAEVAGAAPAPVSSLRRRAARVLAVAAVALALTPVLAALFGAWAVEVFGLSISVSSLRSWRWSALLGFSAALVDPGLAAAAAAAFHARRRALLLGGLAAAAVWLVAYKVCQHLAFHTGAYDLSMFHHAVHNTLHGRFLHAFGIERSFFSEHFSPALLWTLPVYAAWPSATSLLVVQGLAVALALWPLYRLSQGEGLPTHVAALVCAGFFANAVLWRAFVFDFHIELFQPALFFAAAAALFARRFGWFYAWVVALLAVKEDGVLLVLPLAALAVARQRSDWRHALAAAALGLTWAVVAFKLVIPASYPEAATQSHFVGRYGHLGGSYEEILLGLLTRPGYVLERVTSGETFSVIAAVGFVPLLDPLVLLLGLPALGIHLVSGYPYQASLGAYYGLAGMLVFWLSVPRVAAWLQRRRRARLALVVALLPLTVLPGGELPPRPSAQDAAGRALLASLPEEDSICAQTSLLPHLSPDGPRALFPELSGARWVALDLERSPWPLEPADYLAQVTALVTGVDYGVHAFDGRFLVLERGGARGREAEVLEALARPPLR